MKRILLIILSAVLLLAFDVSALAVTDISEEKNNDYANAYLGVLENYQTRITGYNYWKNGDELQDSGVVTIEDVTGDNTPELIFLCRNTSESWNGDLMVWGYVDGRAKQLLKIAPLDLNVGSGTFYCVYLSSTGNLVVYDSMSDEFGRYHRYREYEYTSGDLLLKEEINETNTTQIPSAFSNPQKVLFANFSLSGHGVFGNMPKEAKIYTHSEAKSVLSHTDISNESISDYTFLSRKYLMTRGIGGWGLEVEIQSNGCFTGNYSNSEYGERDNAYPNGTVYFSEFSGSLCDLVKINEYTYSAKISEHIYNVTPGDEEIIDGVRYSAVPIGFAEKGETILIYTPDAPVSQLPQEFLDWVEWPNGKITTSYLGFYGIYVANDSYFGGKGFYQIDAYYENNPENIVSCISIPYGSGIDIDISWGWDLFNKNASEYDHNLAMAALLLSNATYAGADTVEERLKTLGFCDYHFARYRNDPSPFEPGRSIAAQKVSIDGKDKIIIAVVIRGTNNVVPDWITNISAIIDGFSGATSEVMKDVNDSMKTIAKELGCDLTKENTIFYIMGHSQGGAVAGLIADKVLSYAAPENIFTYTFASPNYDVGNNDAPSYTNVHNIISTDDFVPQCYRDWNIAGIFGEQGFKRYGNDWWYDRVDYENTAKEVYAKTGEKSSHDTETYLACLLSGLPKNMGDGVANPYSLSSIHCPVDIIVYNSDGVEMGRTEGGEVILSEDTEVIIYLDGDSKYVMASVDKEYSIQFTATGSGTMTYSQAIVNSYTGEFIEVKEFCNVELYDGKRMSAKFGGETEINEVGLYVQNEYGETIAQIGVDGQETAVEISENDDEPTTQDNLFRKTVVVVIGAGALLLIISAVLVTMLKRKNRGS